MLVDIDEVENKCSLENFGRTGRHVHKGQEGKAALDEKGQARIEPQQLQAEAWEKTYAEQYGDDRETVLRAVREDGGRLFADGQAVQDARRAEQERVAGGERAGEDGRVDDGGQRANAGPADRDDVWRLGGGAGAVEQGGVVVRDEHARHQDAEDVENHDAPEYAADGL